MFRYIVLNSNMTIPGDTKSCGTLAAARRRARWLCEQTQQGKTYIMAAKYDGHKLYMDYEETFFSQF